MPVALPLNEEQVSVFNQALKGKTIPFTNNRNVIQLTRENWEAIRDAIQDLHTKKFKVRTKTVEHLEVCYYAQEILQKIDSASIEFRTPPTNDNVIGVVEVPHEPSSISIVKEEGKDGNEERD